MNVEKQVLIVGGGFGGVACAKRLGEILRDSGTVAWRHSGKVTGWQSGKVAQWQGETLAGWNIGRVAKWQSGETAQRQGGGVVGGHKGGVKVRLVSDKPHFEYHGALYRLVTGGSAMEICIPLREIFEGLDVEVVCDRIEKIDLKKKVVRGESGSVYGYDELVLGLGSETEYYGIPGLEKHAFGFKTIKDALELKRHLHEVIGSCEMDKKGEAKCNAHFVVVGGGASGTELAAELAVYGKKLAKNHGIDPSLVTVDLVQSPNRLLPGLPETLAGRVEAKVRSLGVNVYMNQRLVKSQIKNVWLSDMKMKAKTVVWTAGVRGNRLYEETKGLEVDEKGRVKVDKYLRARGNLGVYVVGDGAATEWGGMAQTALGDGVLVAENMVAKWSKEPMREREQKQPVYAIPCGKGWAAVWRGGREFYGRLGWWLRRYLDWKVFVSLLPARKAWVAFREGGKFSEQCGLCGEDLATRVQTKK